MAAPIYPKLSQEMVKDVVHILTSAMANDSYLESSPYSQIMRNTLREETTKMLNSLTQGVIGSFSNSNVDVASANVEVAPVVKSAEEIDQELTEEIDEQFSEVSDGLENRSNTYKDDFGILIRLERAIRAIERLMKSGGTDSVKLTAVTRFMDLQDKQIDVLERLMNISKVKNIENVTKRFFLELKKHPDLSIVASRYLELIEGLD